MSEDTVLFRRATQLRPPLGCGLKPALPAKAGEETSITRGPRGPKPPVHWRSSDRPLFRTHVQVQTSCPSPHAFRLQRGQQGPPGLLLSSLVAWHWCRPEERGTCSFLLSLRKVNGLQNNSFISEWAENILSIFSQDGIEVEGRGAIKGSCPVLTCELLKFA